ncbi:3-phosphoshikimate 1-carboxyvinyltransferase [Pedosphaera parvula]|uniref:3-phosphoshikimate 1-carboxyvinyltransferase n=1 Tax=Pedosphaera parvula (strain Ellin514) TaxID=320771 RepID=B9XMY7_PEDPL|nr:3-phosphoshikimate 1-carboxyvinyltransferase [Pedosphaera parvula]EEF58783.1 3-phosphoshikimate 1-carboxyvinyltransferase [Pedosphaera parvula Ellin514]
MLPDTIEIVPLEGGVRAEITVPGSKSITNRALILAALADGRTILHGALWSEDTQAMVDCLQRLGFDVEVGIDPEESSDRTIAVQGLGGKIPSAGSANEPLDLFVGNAGTAARFLSAFVCLGQGTYRLHGVKRMHERPQAALFQALRELGYQVDSPNNKLPVIIHGTGPKKGTCSVSIGESSQFASALLLCAGKGRWSVKIVGENTEESPYVVMTSRLVESFPQHGSEFHIEPDASSGSYFWAAGKILSPDAKNPTVSVKEWPTSGWQIDAEFSKCLDLPETISREGQLGDSIMTGIVMAPLTSTHPVRFTDLGRLRVQECERVHALRTELARCGAKAIETGDTLEVFPGTLHGAEIETYNDHRMAMCFAILGLKVSGIKIKNPACVKKTFPDFFQKLAAPAPHGLGVTILHGRTHKPLNGEELFAD